MGMKPNARVRNLDGITAAMAITAALLLSLPAVCLAEDAFIVVRDEPPRVAYRKLTPGPARAVDVSPDIRTPVTPASADMDASSLVQELSENEVARIAAFIPVSPIDGASLGEQALSPAHYRRGGIAGALDRALPASAILQNKEGIAGYYLAGTIRDRTDVGDVVLRAVMSQSALTSRHR